SIDSGSTANFSYDPFRRRVSKTVVGTQTGFLYDGANPVQELSGTTAAANLLTWGVDGYLTRSDSSGARHFLTDAIGSTIALSDSSGAVQTSYTFEPYGNTTVSGATTTSSFAYTGRELDSTGLYYYRDRYYNPAVGRFISEDPIRLASGTTNFYAYAQNDPVNWTDPSDDNICYLVTPNGMKEQPCIDPQGGMTCIDVPGGQSCIVPIPPSPPPGPTGPTGPPPGPNPDPLGGRYSQPCQDDPSTDDEVEDAEDEMVQNIFLPVKRAVV